MIELVMGDALDQLRGMDSCSIDCCVTSPPYWGLRDYGTGDWEGGDGGCDHTVGGQVEDTKAPGAITSGQRPGVDASSCRKCGAVRVDRQLGLEGTPEEYVGRMVGVFREVRRVLRADGTLWLNLGDSYSAGKIGRADHGSGDPTSTLGPQRDGLPDGTYIGGKQRPCPPGLKPKDLVGIPWRVAFALQADGWWLRQDIIWHKPNPMPESVTDRCTKSHEYIFLLTKSARYFYDAEAIKETASDTPGAQSWRRIFDPAKQPKKDATHGETAHQGCGDGRHGVTRNKRSVWTVATKPYPGAHFATFPPALVEPCILAGCRPGGTVLDPFAGTGTVGEVAAGNGRNAVLIELNEEYVPLIEERCGLFLERGS